MEHPGSRGLRRETPLLVAGLDQTTQDSLALDSQVLGPALDLDQEEALEDLFQEGLDLHQGTPWATPSTTIATPTPSIHPKFPKLYPSLLLALPRHEDRGRRRGLDEPPEGRGQPPNPP